MGFLVAAGLLINQVNTVTLLIFMEFLLHHSYNKLVAPSKAIVCLGILVDTVNQTISIPPEKLQEIVKLCGSWKK